MKAKLLSMGALLALILIVGFQNCSGKDTFDVDLGSTGGTNTPTGDGGIFDDEEDPTSENDPHVCTLSISPSKVLLGQSLTYNINPTPVLPSGYRVLWYGKRSNPDGSNQIDDENGTEYSVPNPLNFTMEYSNKSLAGVYLRYVKIESAAGSQLCYSNLQTVELTTVCGLSSNQTTAQVGQTWNVNFDRNPSIRYPGQITSIVWFLRKNGQLVLSGESFEDYKTGTDTYGIPLGSNEVGNLELSAHGRDASGSVLCSTEKINLTVSGSSNTTTTSTTTTTMGGGGSTTTTTIRIRPPSPTYCDYDNGVRICQAIP